MKQIRVAVFAVMTALLAACATSGDNAAPPTDAPVISSFTATPSTITSGQDSVLAWSVDTTATAITISGGIGAVIADADKRFVVSPTVTMIYTLTAVNAGGVSSQNATVTVNSSQTPDPEPEPTPDPEPEEPALQYQVTSDCGKVSTTYATADGGTAQRDFGNGFVYETDYVARDTFLYISAQNQCRRGDVTVRIYKRGSVYRETTSSGAYVIATASGTY